MKSIYVYGASGHGLVVADIAFACGYDDIVFIDDGENKHLTFEDIKENSHIPIALGIGSNFIREKLFNKLKVNNFEIVSLIHPSSIVSKTVTIEDGVIIMPGVIINAYTKISNGVILNSGSIIEHESIIEDFAHISPNVGIAGNVKVGKLTHIGIGSNIIQGIKIGNNSIIGAGSVVVKDINSYKKAYGNPCKEIEDIK